MREKSRALIRAALVLCLLTESGCYFFRTSRPGNDNNDASVAKGVIGASIGVLAGSYNEGAVDEIHGIETTHAPAGVRPDPDQMVRLLIREYREEGSVVAREIGRIEQYRMLLGGASDDFSIAPQESYDATSMLAELKVAEEVCSSLVAPTTDRNGSWTTILPADPSDPTTNIKFLGQRILGVPSDQVTDDIISSLTTILDTAKVGGRYTYASYIPVCATLIIDADALLL